MKEMKLISFSKDDYFEFFRSFKITKASIAILVLTPIVFIAFLFSFTRDLEVSVLFSLLLVVIPYLIMEIGTYLCIINKISTKYYGVGFVPFISFAICYTFLKSVSFDKTFVILASILLSWISTKFILSVCKESSK